MQRSPGPRRLANVTSLIMCGILAGVVVAAAAFPLVGSVGLSAKAASDSFEELPSDLKAGPPPLTSTLYASGIKVTSFYEENRVDVPLKDMAKTMQDAIIAAEDNRFWQHHGTDPKGIVRALVSNTFSNGSSTQGGSTLTQQYVKQALFYSAKTPAERRAAIAPNGARKLQEVRYAISLEQKLSKKEILERYLNIANFGAGSYGVAAASQGYFSRSAGQLSLAEAALLASIVKNPERYNPVTGDKKSAKERRDYVINRMAELNLVDQKVADQARKQPIVLKPKKAARKCENGRPEYGFYCGWFLDWWKSNPKFGATQAERESNLYRGGYTISLALDPKMQADAQKAVDAQLDSTSRFATGIVVVEPGTGYVRAMAINRRYGLTAPATTAPLLTGGAGAPGYQAGSTFKMFTMVAALEKGMPLNTTIYSPQQYRSKFRGTGPCSPRACFKNASPSMTGDQTMWSAFGESANTYFVQLEEMVSVKAAILAAEKLGVRMPDDAQNRSNAFSDDRAYGSFTLGVTSVTPLDMANAYATIAAHGKYCQPLPFMKIVDHDNKPLPYAQPTCRQAIPSQVADAAADAARCPVGNQAAGSCTHPGGHPTAGRIASVGRPVAGKSGTTSGDDGNTPTAWFIGFTPNLAAATFVANPDKATSDDVTALSRVPVSVFLGAAKPALERLPLEDFTKPSDALTYGIRVTVPDVDGRSLEEAKAELTAAGFSFKVSERKEGSQYSQGQVARTEPAGGDRATKGGFVTIYLTGDGSVSGGAQQPGQTQGSPDNGQNTQRDGAPPGRPRSGG